MMTSKPISELLSDKIAGEWGGEPTGTGDSFVIRTANFTNSGKIDFSNLALRHIANIKVAKKRLIDGDIIIEKSGGSPTQPVGRVVFFEKNDGNTYLCNNFTAILRPKKEEVFPKYLFYALHRNYLLGKTLRYQNKTTGIINLKIDNYLQTEISLPPIDDQKRIALLLGKVENLIVQRRARLKELDILLKSIFVTIFSTKRISKTKKLGQVADISSGVTKGKNYGNSRLIEVPYIRVANVQDGYLNLNDVKTIFVTPDESKRYLLTHFDLLLTEGGDPDKLGRGAIWHNEIESAIHQNHIFKVRIKDKLIVNPYYLSALVGSTYGKKYFLKSAKQTTGIASINSTQLKNFPVIIPPVELQNKFASIVEKVERIKNQYEHSLAELESLYGALSQKAFKGELDLSKVPLPEDEPGQAVVKAPEYSIAQDEEPTERRHTFLVDARIPVEQHGVMITDYREIFTYPRDCEDHGFPELSIDDERVFSIMTDCKQPFAFEDILESFQLKEDITPNVLHSIAKSLRCLLQQGRVKQEFNPARGRAICLRVTK